jgi:hypothetical protein
MGADFDGDIVTVFRSIPYQSQDPPIPPSALAFDEVRKQPVFLPGKQYLYGLSRLIQVSSLRMELQKELRRHDAPAWPENMSCREGLLHWSKQAAESNSPRSDWWSIVEQCALRALSESPGMGLEMQPFTELQDLKVVEAKAVKEDVFTNVEAGSEAYQAYEGDSLAPYKTSHTAAAGEDLIKTIMVSAAACTGNFGSVCRKLLYAAKNLTKEFVRDAQCLSEQAMQRVLSVKAGKKPLSYALFKKHILTPLLKAEVPDFMSLPNDLKDLFEPTEMQEACRRISANIYPDPPAWLKWLRRPRQLVRLLNGPKGCIELPIADPRVRPFLESPTTGLRTVATDRFHYSFDFCSVLSEERVSADILQRATRQRRPLDRIVC